jgi:hypothetical protein
MLLNFHEIPLAEQLLDTSSLTFPISLCRLVGLETGARRRWRLSIT